MPSTKGKLVIRIVEELEKAGFNPVYLRNYENLPVDVGNDVDLLIPEGMARKAERLACETAEQVGWTCFKAIQFGPLSLFFHNRTGDDFVHIDLFTRLEWHFLPIADTALISARRRLHGMVFIPDPMDELFLNLFTRLCYEGVVREKHRKQAANHLLTGESGQFRQTVADHVGQACSGLLVSHAISGTWDDLEASASRCRKLLFSHVLFKRTADLAVSMVSFIHRGSKRLISPPGPFIVFAGGDPTLRSKLIDSCIPLLVALTGKSKILHFHGRPSRRSVALTGTSPDRQEGNTGYSSKSFFLLCHHWLGLWSDYFRCVLPSISRNHPVIGNQYGDGLFPVPARTGIRPHSWLECLAFDTIPAPDLVICLMTRAELLAAYGEGLKSKDDESTSVAIRNLESGRKNFKVVLTDRPEEDSTATVRSLVLELFSNHRSKMHEV